MSTFVGRVDQLAVLDGLLARVVADQGARPGRALLMRGRRRVGKSRLVEEFLTRADVPHVFFTASTRSTTEEVALFVDEVAHSTLPGASTFAEVSVGSWEAALRLLAGALPTDQVCVVVLDELSYLTATDPAFEGTLQKVFDRELSKRRVLLIGIGSDLAMMESLNAYGRPFHQRAGELVVPALNPAEVGAMLGLGPADALDAYLVTGGLPLVLDEWRRGRTLWRYLDEALSSPTSALLVSGERALAAELAPQAQARAVLAALGGTGERTFTTIQRGTDGLTSASLNRSLRMLTDKRIVAAERPLSTHPSRETRYRVADPYLRFWLAFLGPSLPEIERGRGDRVLARIKASWPSWRGRAIEPVIREAIDRLPPAVLPLAQGVGAVGGYWTRTNDPEIDLVLADHAPVASRILGVGSIKWDERSPFGARDLARLIVHRAALPGATDETALIAVARFGCEVGGVRHLSPRDLLLAWHR